jgi:hypothetical protein
MTDKHPRIGRVRPHRAERGRDVLAKGVARSPWIGLIVMVGASVVCRTDSFLDAFPSPRETLRAVGRRLSRSWSERDWGAIASRDAAILDLLEPADRQALVGGSL